MSTSRSTQAGAATLFVTVIILLVTLLLGLYTSRGLVSEIKVGAIDARTRIAYNHAEAGMQGFLNALANTAGFDRSQAFAAGLTADVSASLEGDVVRYNARMCSGSIARNALPVCPAAPADFTCGASNDLSGRYNWLVSCGWSTDASAVRRVVTMVTGVPPLANPPSNPVITRGSVNVGGNATVVNYYNNLTYWSASTLTSNSATGKTAIRNPSPAANAVTPTGTQTLGDAIAQEVGNGNTLCANNNVNRPIVCTTTSSSVGVGADVIGGDTTLGNLNATQFFENFMGTSPEAYRAMAQEKNRLYQHNALGSMTQSAIYWIDVPAGQSASFGAGTPIGSNGNPAIVIVDGNLNFTSGSLNIFGLVYVRGNVTGTGSPTIRGSMIVEGTMSTTGGVTIIYDPTNLGFDGANFTSFTIVPGTWRDF